MLCPAVSLSCLSIYNAELFPTSIRSTVMGLHSQAARAGSIAAPFILVLGQQLGSDTFAPFLLYGASSLAAGTLLLAMPETLGFPMPETVKVRGGTCCNSLTFESAAPTHGAAPTRKQRLPDACSPRPSSEATAL